MGNLSQSHQSHCNQYLCKVDHVKAQRAGVGWWLASHLYDVYSWLQSICTLVLLNFYHHYNPRSLKCIMSKLVYTIINTAPTTDFVQLETFIKLFIFTQKTTSYWNDYLETLFVIVMWAMSCNFRIFTWSVPTKCSCNHIAIHSMQ